MKTARLLYFSIGINDGAFNTLLVHSNRKNVSLKFELLQITSCIYFY